MQFTGTENYIVSKDLSIAVNAAIQLQKPLLIKGEPGTGKTLLAFEIAKALNKKIYKESFFYVRINLKNKMNQNKKDKIYASMVSMF